MNCENFANCYIVSLLHSNTWNHSAEHKLTSNSLASSMSQGRPIDQFTQTTMPAARHKLLLAYIALNLMVEIVVGSP